MTHRVSTPPASSPRAASSFSPASSLTACGSDDAAADAGGGLESTSRSPATSARPPRSTWEGEVDVEDIETEVADRGRRRGARGRRRRRRTSGSATATPRRRPTTPTSPRRRRLLIGEISEPLRGGAGGQHGRLPRRRGRRRGGRLRRGRQPPAQHRQQGRARLRGRPDRKVGDGPSGEERDAAKWAPRWSRPTAPSPASTSPTPTSRSKNLLDTTLVKGDGAVVESGQTIVVNYLGQVYDAEDALRRELPQGAHVVPDRRRRRSSAAGTRRWSARPSAPASSCPSRRPTATARRQQGRRHQGHRHAVLRRRHPRRSLTVPRRSKQGGAAWRRSPSDCSTSTSCCSPRRRFVSKQDIRRAHYGEYPDSPRGLEAFEKAFERDKEDLRELGVVIEVGSLDSYFEDEQGYRISPDTSSLPEIRFEADEAAVLGIAARAWEQHTLAAGHHRGDAQAGRPGRRGRHQPARPRAAQPARRGAGLRRLLGGHPEASRHHLRLPPTRRGPARTVASSRGASSARPDGGTSWLRPRSQGRACLPALPGPGQGDPDRARLRRTTSRPAPT